MKYHVLICALVFMLCACEKESSKENAIANIPVDFVIERFDLAFAEAKASDLPELKTAYPFMFSKRYKDSFWLKQMRDTIQLELSQETKLAFQDFKPVKQDIKKLFQHLDYYYPEFNTPRIITTTNYVDYRNKVIVTDSIAIIALDTYLGSEHRFYNGIQSFLSDHFNPDDIVIDLADAYAKRFSYDAPSKTLLDEMIKAGKHLYFKDVMIPFKADAEKIGYTPEQLDWSQVNESYIWRYFVERELLFNTDAKLPSRFINDAPFSKFYLEEIDNESPARIGQYIGWQMVRAYMKNNEVSLQEMLKASTEEIYSKSKFKPRK